MKISDHLSLRTPLLWVTSEEPGRVIDTVLASTQRPVFRLDAVKGLIRWTTDEAGKGKWLRVLVPDGQGGLMPTNDPTVAFGKVLDEKGILLIENAHTQSDALANFFVSVVLNYRQGLYEDDIEKIPAQFVLISHEEKPPAEITRMVSHLVHELPDEDDIQVLIRHISRQLPQGDPPEIIARAAMGLSETEFVTSAMLSAREEGSVYADFVSTYKNDLLKRSGVLDVRSPALGLDDLGGLDKAKELVTQIEWTWNNPKQAEKMSIEPLRRLLMVGVSGTGKSLVCEAIASMLKLDLGKGGVSNAMSKWVGESERNMRQMFAALKRMAPIVFWIDEFGRDMSGGMSSGSVDGGTTDRVHGEFLTGVQELPHNVFLAAAANNIHDLPPEMLRADRFDKIMFVGFPTQHEREEIFGIHLGAQREQYSLQKLAQATPYFTGAEIKALIKEVRFTIGTKEERSPTTEEIIRVAPHMKSRVWINHRDVIITMYQRALVEWHWASSAQEAQAHETIADARKGMTSPVPSYKPKTMKKPSFTPKFSVPKDTL